MSIKIIETFKVERNSYGVSFCPFCKGSVWQNKDESNYCFRCGHALDWGVESS